MSEVARIRTPISVTQAAQELVAALVALGEKPSRQEAELLLSQIWLETSRGNSCDNHNPGNISATPKWTGSFFRPAWFTVDATSSHNLQVLHEAMLKGRAPNAFRSYQTFQAGFEDYVRMLFVAFPSIIRAARRDDALALSQAIRSSGYNPDNPVIPTSLSLQSLQREFRARGVFAALPLVVPAPPASVS